MAKLKILVLHPKDWASGYAGEFGAEVRHVSIGGAIPRRSSGEPTQDGIGEIVTNEGVQELFRVAAEWQPDVFLFGIHHGFQKQMLETLKDRHRNMKLVMHYTDQRDSVSKFVVPFVNFLDLLLVTNRDAMDHSKYIRAGIPQVGCFYDGVNPREYWPQPSKIFWDCIFGGHNYKGLERDLRKKGHTDEWIGKFSGADFRERFLEEVNANFRLVIRGTWGWDKSVFNVRPARYHPYYLACLRQAKIILNTINVVREKLYTRRLFRSVATGTMYLTQYCPGYEDYFENHKHFVWYNSIEEGLDLMQYYIDHDEQRERIARQGRQLLVDKHTFKHRLGEFVEIIRRSF